jgi:hypothetical protein
MHDKLSTTEKNAADSLAISMAMRIRRYSAERIAQSGRSRATLDATGRRTPPSGEYLPRIAPADTMVLIDFGIQNKVVALRNRFSKLELNRHETNPLLSSSKRQAA